MKNSLDYTKGRFNYNNNNSNQRSNSKNNSAISRSSSKNQISKDLYHQLNKLDILSTLLAAVCHDLGHDGFTNGYHVNRLTKRAIDCNDVAV